MLRKFFNGLFLSKKSAKKQLITTPSKEEKQSQPHEQTTTNDVVLRKTEIPTASDKKETGILKKTVIPQVEKPILKATRIPEAMTTKKTINTIVVDIVHLENKKPDTNVYYEIYFMDKEKNKCVVKYYATSVADIGRALGIARTTISNHINKTEKKMKVKPLFKGQIIVNKVVNG